MRELHKAQEWLWRGLALASLCSLLVLAVGCATPAPGPSSSSAPAPAPTTAAPAGANAAAPTQAPATNVPAATATTAPVVAKPAAPSATAPAAAKAPAAPQGTLRHAFLISPSTFNPHQTQAVALIQYDHLTYETLLTVGPDGKFAPQLATEWQIGDKTVTFKLRPGVVFHDGAPFNAAAVVANIKDIKEGAFAPAKNDLKAIDSVEALDELTVRFNLSAFDPALLRNLTLLSGMQISPAALKTADKQPVGTGPWMYNAQESKTDSKYVFDYFPKYWNPSQIGVARIEILPIAEAPTRMNALLSGEVDSADLVSDPAVLRQLESRGFKSLIITQTAGGFMVLDRQGTQAKPLGDRRVRQALALSVDRDAYFNSQALGSPLPQPYRPGEVGYVKDLANLNYNPQRAKALLAEAGVADLEIAVPSAQGFLPRNQALATFFADLGIKLKINAIAPGTIAPECASGKWTAAVCPIPELHPKTLVENRLLKNGVYNPFKVEDPRIEELYAKAKNLPDEQGADLWGQIMKIALEDGDMIFLGPECTGCVAFSPKVKVGGPRSELDFFFQMRDVTVEK